MTQLKTYIVTKTMVNNYCTFKMFLYHTHCCAFYIILYLEIQMWNIYFYYIDAREILRFPSEIKMSLQSKIS